MESTLKLCAVDLNDTGVYSCTATNSQGSDRYNFALDVVPTGELLITTIIPHTQGMTTVVNQN